MVQIRERLLKEKMNPLRLDAANFTVVEGSSGEVIAFAQLEQVSAAAAAAGDQPIYEFRSLVVAPEHRGKGHGSALVQQMMADCPHDCYLTTVSRAIPFYENAGFRTLQLNELPQFLWFEFAAGSLVARLAVNDTLVAMARLRAG